MSMPKIECCDIDKCCAATSLLQSIALEEAAIAHILNAEGEKLQKAISMDCRQKDLIDINKSVEDMIDKITALENVLKTKLELVAPILYKCEKNIITTNASLQRVSSFSQKRDTPFLSNKLKLLPY